MMILRMRFLMTVLLLLMVAVATGQSEQEYGGAVETDHPVEDDEQQLQDMALEEARQLEQEKRRAQTEAESKQQAEEAAFASAAEAARVAEDDASSKVQENTADEAATRSKGKFGSIFPNKIAFRSKLPEAALANIKTKLSGWFDQVSDISLVDRVRNISKTDAKKIAAGVLGVWGVSTALSWFVKSQAPPSIQVTTPVVTKGERKRF